MIEELAYIEHRDGTRTLYAKVCPVVLYEIYGSEVIAPARQTPYWEAVPVHPVGTVEAGEIDALVTGVNHHRPLKMPENRDALIRQAIESDTGGSTATGGMADDGA